MTTFPPEIIELIVHSARDQGINLSSLLLVSSSFSHPARPLVFQTVRLAYDVRSLDHLNSRCGLLLDILDGDPGILNHVQSVVIHVQFFARVSLVEHNWNGSEARLFASVLERLSKGPRISDLYIRSLGKNFNMTLWPLKFVEALLALRCNPSIRTLGVSRITHLPWLLLTGVAPNDCLQTLILGNTQLQTSPTNLLYPFDAETLPSFLSAVISPTPDTDGGHFPFAHLEDIRLEGDDLDRFSWFPCRRIGSGSAQEDYAAAWRPPSDGFTFPNLRSITLSPSVHWEAIWHKRTISTFFEVSPRLEEVSLRCPPAASFSAAMSRFALLNELLSSHSVSFPTIRVLRLLDAHTGLWNYQATKPFADKTTPIARGLETLAILGISPRSISYSEDDWAFFGQEIAKFPVLRKLILGFVGSSSEIEATSFEVCQTLVDTLSVEGRIEVVVTIGDENT